MYTLQKDTNNLIYRLHLLTKQKHKLEDIINIDIELYGVGDVMSDYYKILEIITREIEDLKQIMKGCDNYE